MNEKGVYRRLSRGVDWVEGYVAMVGSYSAGVEGEVGEERERLAGRRGLAAGKGQRPVFHRPLDVSTSLVDNLG